MTGSSLVDGTHSGSSGTKTPDPLFVRALQIFDLNIIDIDLTTRESRWTGDLERILGIAAGSVERSLATLLSFIHPEDRARIDRECEQLLSDQVPIASEFRILRRNGEIRTISQRAELIGSDDRATRCLIVLRDITEERGGESRLRDNEAHLARAQDIAGISSVEYDLASQSGRWSDGAYRIYGLVPGEVDLSVGQFIKMVHPADRAVVADDYRRQRLGELPPDREYRIIRPSGEIRTVHRATEMIRNADGTPAKLFMTLRDITDLRASEEKRLRSEEHLARAQRLAGIGSWERDFVTGETKWSDEMVHIYGLDSAEGPIDDHTFLALVHPDDVPLIEASRRAAVLGEVFPDSEYRIVRPDGELRVLIRSSEITLDQDGKPRRLLVSLRDITELRANEERLRSSESHLERAQRIAEVGSAEVDFLTHRSHWSLELYRIFGIDPAEGPPSPGKFLEFIHPDNRTIVDEDYRYEHEGHAPPDREYRIIRPDGVMRTVYRTAEITRDADGKPIKLFVTLRDITDLRANEEKLRRSEAHLARAQKLAGIGSWERDLATGEAKASDEYFRLVGRDPADGIPSDDEFLEQVHPDDRAAMIANRLEIMTGRDTGEFEFRVILPDGKTLTVLRSSELVRDADGKPIRILVTAKDITEQRAGEERLRRSEAHLARAQKLAGIVSWERDAITGEGQGTSAYFSLVGRDPPDHDLNAEEFMALVHPDDRATLLANRRTTGDIEFRLLAADGRYRSIVRSRQWLPDGNGESTRFLVIAKDVTEQRTSEERLRRSEAHLARAQNLASIGSEEIDLATGEVTWSEGLFRLFGFNPVGGIPTRDEIGRTVSPDDLAGIRADRRQQAEGKTPPDREYRIRRADGTVITVLRSAEVTLGETGKPARLLVTLRDITALRGSEQKLRRSERHLARAQRLAGVGSAEMDILTGEIEWSDETYRIYGLDPAKVQPSLERYYQSVHPDDAERVRQEQLIALETGKPHQCEYRIIRPDGEIRHLIRASEATFDAEGKPLTNLVTLKDVTEERLTEERLRRSEEHLARAQNLAGVGSAEVDFSGGKFYWSDEMYRIHGLEPNSIAANWTLIEGVVHPDDRTRVAANRERILAGGSESDIEYRIVRPDGVVRMIFRTASVTFDEAGKPDRYLVTVQDVTELRAAERQRDEYQRQLQHAQRIEALGTLAGGIAHDLNNTLVPILALSKLLLKHARAGGTERYNLETIQHAAQRATELVQQIVTFSRNAKPQRLPIDLRDVIGDTLRMLRASIPAAVRLNESLEAVPAVLADVAQIHQVIINLVTNAAQSIGHRDGHIDVRLERSPSEPLWVRLSVADTGSGIDDRTKAHIFEPFFTTKSVGEGTGLGLSIVHSIVASHGGRITVTSAPGQGTRFDVLLPIEEASPATP